MKFLYMNEVSPAMKPIKQKQESEKMGPDNREGETVTDKIQKRKRQRHF